MIPDELLDKLGTYYTSRYVEINQPHIKEIPFEQWLERQIKERSKEDVRFSRGA